MTRRPARPWLPIAATLLFCSTLPTPAPAADFPAGTNPTSVAVGDFDGDGRLDLAVANAGSNTISVLLGKGNGKFRAAPDVSAGLGPVFVAVDDFNGDGKPDLVVASLFSSTSIARHFHSRPVSRTPLLPNSGKHLPFCLLHAPRGFGVAFGACRSL